MISPGSKFGDFQILDVLGQGGMGTVYKAKDRLGRIVAIKTLNQKYSDSTDFRRLLTREAGAVARINSLHVVKIWEHGEIAGQLYVSLEFVDGPELDKASAHMAFLDKVEAAKQLARGITAAHTVGLLHRDIKPANIKITRDVATGQSVLKILDFGLAKPVSDFTAQVTQSAGDADSGTVFAGSLCYASPEQLTGETLTFRSDLFSVGVVLYEFFTGHRPFGGPHPSSVVYSILTDDPPAPRDICQDMPLWLDQIIVRALAKSPDDRFQTSHELLQSLEDPHDYLSPSSPPLIPSRRTVTVVGLRNLSGDPQWDYFSEGFSEDVTRELSRRTSLIVSAQPSGIFTSDLATLVKKCRSDFVITGSMLRWQDRIKINLNVYQSRTLQLLAGDTYEGDVGGLFDLLAAAARDISIRLAEETGGTIAEVEDPFQMDISAYEYYSKGRTYYMTLRLEDLRIAEDLYRRALQLEPDLALVHAGLSDLYSSQYMLYFDRTHERIEAAEREALLAIQLSPRLPEAYRSQGRYYLAIQDYTNAERSLLHSIECNPKYALAYRSMAWVKEFQGDHDESMRWARKALSLAPLDLETLVLVGVLFMDTGKYTAALSQLQRAVDMAPDYGRAHYGLGSVYLKIGAIRQADREYELACTYKGDPNAHIQSGYVALIQGKLSQAVEKFTASVELGSFPFAADYYLGVAYRLMGQQPEAMCAFQRCVSATEEDVSWESKNLHFMGFRAMALAGLGCQQEALLILQNMAGRQNLDGEPLYCMARAYAELGALSEAEEYSRRALAAHAGPSEVELALDPILAAARKV